jgi:hypothetical protein
MIFKAVYSWKSFITLSKKQLISLHAVVDLWRLQLLRIALRKWLYHTTIITHWLFYFKRLFVYQNKVSKTVQKQFQQKQVKFVFVHWAHYLLHIKNNREYVKLEHESESTRVSVT